MRGERWVISAHPLSLIPHLSSAMRVDLFDFHLPKECIATHPASPRESALLLHITSDTPEDMTVADIPSLLRPGDVLVVNDTRVIPARLFAQKCADSSSVMPAEAGISLSQQQTAKIEILLHKDLGDGRWQVFAKPGKKLKPGGEIVFIPHSSSPAEEELSAKILEKLPSGEVVVLFNKKEGAFMQALPRYGAPPLPPYIDRPHGATAEDVGDYQTCYAAHDGSVAAPTAGLHFTPALMAAVRKKGVTIEKVTLHVGAGTFQPVKVDDTEAHIMHSEWGEVCAETAARINAIKASGGRVVAVGTTSLRLLESAADEAGVLHPFCKETAIFITPGYRFRVVDCLMTNFHLPKSTLFMLVSAFAGRARMLAAYAHAIAQGYRFYSYGDACFLERCDEPDL